MSEKMWRWADVKMSRCERRCEDEQMWEKMWENMWEKMWRWADVREDVREDVKMSKCEDEQMWRWADVREDVREKYDEESEQMREDVREDVREDMKMSRCEDEQMWEKMWRWADVKMSRCEDEKVWRWEGEIQTPTIGRTLRSDALGNKGCPFSKKTKIPMAHLQESGRLSRSLVAFSYAKNQKMGRCDLSTWSLIPMAHRQKQFQVKSSAKHWNSIASLRSGISRRNKIRMPILKKN